MAKKEKENDKKKLVMYFLQTICDLFHHCHPQVI